VVSSNQELTKGNQERTKLTHHSSGMGNIEMIVFLMEQGQISGQSYRQLLYACVFCIRHNLLLISLSLFLHQEQALGQLLVAVECKAIGHL
jgi:hypothetical protein